MSTGPGSLARLSAAGPAMISTRSSRPALARLAWASATFSGLTSRVVMRPPVVRAASASQIVEKALEVPTSRIRVARVARIRSQRSRPVSRVMLSMRLGRAVSRASLSSPNLASLSRSSRSVQSTLGETVAQGGLLIRSPDLHQRGPLELGQRLPCAADGSQVAVAVRRRTDVLYQAEAPGRQIVVELNGIEATGVGLASATNGREGPACSGERQRVVQDGPVDVREDHPTARGADGNVSKEGIDDGGRQVVGDTLANEERPGLTQVPVGSQGRVQRVHGEIDRHERDVRGKRPQ